MKIEGIARKGAGISGACSARVTNGRSVVVDARAYEGIRVWKRMNSIEGSRYR
jgi:hypothetical protein